jgi:hypothetical protein
MPAKMLMTWVPSTKRWSKKFKGKTYSVSCRQLGTPATKEASLRASNLWWEKKEEELKEAAKPPPDPLVDTLVSGLSSNASDKLNNTILEGPIKAILCQLTGIATNTPDGLDAAGKEFARRAGDGEISREFIHSCFRSDQSREWVEKTFTHEVPEDRTIAAQVTTWLAGLRAETRSGQMDAGRYDSYRREIHLFRDWAGQEQSVETINFDRMDKYKTHLLERIEKQQYSAGYAAGMLTTAKRFVRRLAKRALVPQLDLDDLRIEKGEIKIEVFKATELRELIDGAMLKAPKTALYLLLMMNCGFNQTDIAELGVNEVSFERGTITRSRGKTDAVKVRWMLWPETLELLRKFKLPDDGPVILNPRGHARILLTEKDKPLVQSSLHEDGRLKRTDNIKSAYRRLLDRLELGRGRPLKSVRKTSSTLLGRHRRYKYYAQYFLAHKPRTVAQQSYVKPSKREFVRAVAWLRKKYGFGGEEATADAASATSAT